jgi:hypothetical protein
VSPCLREKIFQQPTRNVSLVHKKNWQTENAIYIQSLNILGVGGNVSPIGKNRRQPADAHRRNDDFIPGTPASLSAWPQMIGYFKRRFYPPPGGLPLERVVETSGEPALGKRLQTTECGAGFLFLPVELPALKPYGFHNSNKSSTWSVAGCHDLPCQFGAAFEYRIP